MDEPRPGRPRTITDEQVERVVTPRLRPSPRTRRTGRRGRWRRDAGVTQNAVLRIWHAFGLQPHRQETFKLSTDPQFIEKVHDICGLYLNPPERAVVLCVDEKSQIQALDRTPPILPMLPGMPSAPPTTTSATAPSSLYAALDLSTGKVIGRLHSRHRAIEFQSSCRRSTPRSPPTSTCTSCSTTLHPQDAGDQRWLARTPVRLHFTPTSSSWMNLVERWFAELTTKLLSRGAHRSSASSTPTSAPGSRPGTRTPPYVWTKTADQILESISRYCERINQSGH